MMSFDKFQATKEISFKKEGEEEEKVGHIEGFVIEKDESKVKVQTEEVIVIISREDYDTNNTFKSVK